MFRRLCVAGAGAPILCAAAWQAGAPRPVEAANPAPFQALDESKATLKLVQVVFRHGARTPLSRDERIWRQSGTKWDVCDCYKPTVPLALYTTSGAPAQPNTHNLSQVNRKLEGGNCHVGQLTRYGQKQALELGQWLRQRYVQQLKFLKPSYEDGVLQSRTTNYQRTIATLAGLLTGLLGEDAPDQLKQPIPVITSSDFDEILFGDSKACPYLKLYMKMGKDVANRLVASDPDQAWARVELERLGYLPPATPGKTGSSFADVYDIVAALQAAEKPTPPGITPELMQVINRLATKAFAPKVAPSLTVEHAHATIRLSMGRLLDMLVTNMEHAVSGQATPRMHLYSGHDSTIMPLLSAMGIDTLNSWPPFLSNLVFELWQLPAEQGGQHVVRVMYNRRELEIPHCPQGMYATLEMFKHEVVGPFLLTQADLSEACHVPVEHDTLSHLPAESLSSPHASQ